MYDNRYVYMYNNLLKIAGATRHIHLVATTKFTDVWLKNPLVAMYVDIEYVALILVQRVYVAQLDRIVKASYIFFGCIQTWGE